MITDFSRYPEWNPFVVACRSDLQVGSPIEMRVHVLPWFTQAQRETIFEHEPGRRLVYGLRPQALGSLESRRCHELTALPSGSSRYRSHFRLSGWLAPLVAGLLGRRLQIGFHAMSEGIRARAETLHEAARRPA